jgi:predicted DNA-binding protein YlxM (UPF0122 family)
LFLKCGDPDVQYLAQLLNDYPPTMSVEEVAEVLKVSKEVVWSLIRPVDRNGTPVEDPLPAYKVGKSWAIVRDELREWLLRRRNTNL